MMPIVFASLLVAGCGGGDDAPPPPEPLADAAHTIDATDIEAKGLVSVVGRAGQASFRTLRDLGEFDAAQRLVELLFPRVFGADVSEGGDTVEVNCNNNPLRLAPLGLCFGKFRFESNRRDRNGPITTGTLFSVQFDNFNIVSGDFQRLRISGGFGINYVTDYTQNPRTGTVSYTSRGLSTNREGTIFAPRNGALTATYGDGRTLIESGSRRYVDIDAASVSDLEGLMRSGRIRTNFGAGHVDVDYSNWSIVDGIVQPGSTANVTGAEGSLASIVVVASTAQVVTLAVTITRDGVPVTFTIDVPASELVGN